MRYQISLEDREVQTDDVAEFNEAVKREEVPMSQARCTLCGATMVDVAKSCQTPETIAGEAACINQACEGFHQVVIVA